MPEYSKALLGLLATSYATHAAAGSYSHEVDRMGLYKNVRTIIGAKNNSNLRKLQGTLTTRCFTHCIEAALSPEDCLAYIESEIEAAGGHEVGPVTVKIQEPRPPAVLSDTYWMTEVPVNVYGQMTCDRSDGTADYPFLWTVGGSGIAVPVVDCQGMTAGECCLKIRAEGEALGKDDNGNCLACFPHQEPLIPVVGEGGTTFYQDYEWSGETCDQLTLSPSDVGTADTGTGTAIISAASALQSFKENPTCTDFGVLLAQLYDASVVIPSLPQYIGRLACDYCYGVDTIESTPELIELIDLILSALDPVPEFDSTENCVIIYTNKNGDIAEAPKLGGSRADDPYDDDCPPDGSTGPTGGDPTGGPEGTTGGGDDSTGGGDDSTGGGDDSTGGTDVPGETCYAPNPDATELSPYVEDDTCTQPGSEKKDGLDYSMTFIKSEVAADLSETVFTYNVCTAPQDCSRRHRRTKGGPSFNPTAAISHVTIGIEGSCVVTGFSMEGGTADFGETLVYELGGDSTTCVSGFKYENGWDTVAEDGCVTGDWCRELTITVAGAVPANANGSGSIGAIKASTGYTEFPGLPVPDCSGAVCP